MRVAIRVALLALAAACAASDDVAGPSDLPSTTRTPVVAATTTSTSTTTTTAPAETTTTTAPHREMEIRGTGKVYTLEESQAFGEFGPLLWNLVTTIHQKNAIEHHPRYEWVIWGPLWSGHIYDPTRSHDVYGVTDLDAIEAEEVAGAVPAGTTIILREVRWSLDDLNAWSPELGQMVHNQVGQSICAISTHAAFGFTLEVAESRLDYVEGLVDSLVVRTSVPREAVILEVSDACPRIRYLPT
jgi:hypothetical protein